MGAGKHESISSDTGVIFSRVRNNDKLIVGMELPLGQKTIPVASLFADGTLLRDAYSQQTLTVIAGNVTLTSKAAIVLLEEELPE